MPDDSSGIYSVPAGTIVTTGDTILPSQHNPWANDSASAISARFSKDGRAPATGNWNLNNFRITGLGAPVAGGDAVNKTYADATFATTASVALKLDILQPSVDVASAATTDIGAAASQNVQITGSVTITSLGTAAAGTFRRLRFAGALTLTHNGTSLILPGAANVTTASGDVAEFISEGSGNWRCVDYTLASGIPLNSASTLALFNASGSAPVYACRAWVNFNGTGTVAIRASGNVSSITDNGTGDYTINFTTAMPNANYAVVGISSGSASTSSMFANLSGGGGGAANSTPSTTSSVSVQIRRMDAVSGTAPLIDVPYNHIAVFC